MFYGGKIGSHHAMLIAYSGEPQMCFVIRGNMRIIPVIKYILISFIIYLYSATQQILNFCSECNVFLFFNFFFCRFVFIFYFHIFQYILYVCRYVRMCHKLCHTVCFYLYFVLFEIKTTIKTNSKRDNNNEIVIEQKYQKQMHFNCTTIRDKQGKQYFMPLNTNIDFHFCACIYIYIQLVTE